MDDTGIGQDEQLEVQRVVRAIDEPKGQRTYVGAGEGRGDCDRRVGRGFGDGHAAAAGDQVAIKDAIEVVHHRTVHLGIVVVVRRRVDAPIDATNDRNSGVDDEELDVVDHLLSHRVIDDVDAGGAELS